MKDNERLKIPYGQVSVYIPKHERNFIAICMLYNEGEFEDQSFSQFILDIIKGYINNLSPKDRKKFEEYAYQLAKVERPAATKFVDKFITEHQ